MKPRRYRAPQAKPGQLVAGYGKIEPRGQPSVCYAWGGAGACSADGRILSNALEGAPVFDGKTLVEELEARGYDLSTLRFSIEKI